MLQNIKIKKRKEKKNKLFILIFSVISIIVFLVMVCIKQTGQVMMCFIIYFAYIILFIGVIKIYRYSLSLHVLLIIILTFVRYGLLPFLIMLDVDYLSYVPLGNYHSNMAFFYYGALMTLWELLVVGMFLKRKLPKWQKYYKFNNSQIIISNSNFILLFFLLLLLLLIILSPAVLNNFSLVISMDNLRNNAFVFGNIDSNSGVIYQLAYMAIRCLKILIPIPFLSFFYKKYIRTERNIYFFACVLVLIVPYALIIEGNSRNTILIPAISMMLILMSLFEVKKKGIAISASIFICLLGALSIVWKSLSSFTSLETNSLSFWISYLELYFAGISNMGKSVVAKLQYGKLFPIDILFNDLFQNVPFLSSFVNLHNTSSYYFFQIWGRNDQVIPATGNGLFYFGFFFAPLVPVIIISLGAYFMKKAYSATNIPELVIYIYGGTIITYNSFNSISSLMMKITIFIIPVLIIVKLNKIVVLKGN